MTVEESLALLALPEATTGKWIVQLSEPHRHYHTLDHVKAMLSHYDGVHPEIVAAIWLHDIIYDPRAHDNEERSAEQARADLPSGPSAKLVVRLILDSKHHLGGDPWTDLFNDLDLGIIGSDPGIYDRYAEQIRLEYAFVPDEVYRPAEPGYCEASTSAGSSKRKPSNTSKTKLIPISNAKSVVSKGGSRRLRMMRSGLLKSCGTVPLGV